MSQHGGRRENSGRKSFLTDADRKEANRLRALKFRAKKRSMRQNAVPPPAVVPPPVVVPPPASPVVEDRQLQILKKRLREQEAEIFQLKMERFEKENVVELVQATTSAAQVTEEELDRERLSEGAYLKKYPPHRVTPSRQKIARRQIDV